MTKILKVIDPFLRLDFGDMFEQDENGDYVATVQEDFTDDRDNGSTFSTKYHANFIISADYAAQMVKDGYLEEVQPKRDFVNVFDEIDKLISKYTKELTDLDKEDIHPAIKREKQVVFDNLLTVLDHLKELKK